MRAGEVIPQVVSPITQRRTGKEKKYRPPEEVPRLRDADRQARGRGLDALPEPLRLPGPGRSRRSSTSPRRGRWTSRASARSSSTASTTRGSCARCRTSTRLTVERLEQLEGFQRKSAENLVERDRALEGAAVQPRALRARHPGHRLRERPRARGALRLDRPADGGVAPRRSRQVEGIGPVLAGTISETLAEPRNREADRGAARGRAAARAGARRERRRRPARRARRSS